MTPLSRLVAMSTLSLGLVASAQGPRRLFVIEDAVLLREPKAKAGKVLALPRGAPVTWHAAAEKDPAFHQVSFGDQQGFVRLAVLSPSEPQALHAPDGKAVSPFAAQGHVKCDLPGRPKPAVSGPEAEKAHQQLEALEALNASTATPAALAAKSDALRAGPARK